MCLIATNTTNRQSWCSCIDCTAPTETWWDWVLVATVRWYYDRISTAFSNICISCVIYDATICVSTRLGWYIWINVIKSHKVFMFPAIVTIVWLLLGPFGEPFWNLSKNMVYVMVPTFINTFNMYSPVTDFLWFYKAYIRLNVHDQIILRQVLFYSNIMVQHWAWGHKSFLWFIFLCVPSLPGWIKFTFHIKQCFYSNLPNRYS